MKTLTVQAVRELAAATMLDPRTVKRAYETGAVRPGARERIVEAAKKLGHPPPPRPK